MPSSWIRPNLAVWLALTIFYTIEQDKDGNILTLVVDASLKLAIV